MSTHDHDKADIPLFTFGLIADMQYCNPLLYGRHEIKGNPSSSRSRHYLKTPNRLRQAIDSFVEHDASFCVSLGDLIDRGFESFDLPLQIMQESGLTWYHVLGNHEFSVSDRHKLQVREKLGMPANYYHFDLDKIRFIVLNANEYSAFAHPRNSKLYKESCAMRKHFKELAAHKDKDDPWFGPSGAISGALGSVQLAFLQQCLQEAQEAGQRVIFFSHQPVDWIWDYHDVMDTVRPFRESIALCLSGHLHYGDEEVLEGIPSISLKAMLESPHNAYTLATVYEDRLELVGYGRQDFCGNKGKKNLAQVLLKKMERAGVPNFKGNKAGTIHFEDPVVAMTSRWLKGERKTK